MPRRNFLKEELRNLKFEDCLSCRFALTKQCRSCDSGEFFEDADQPREVCDMLHLWDYNDNHD